MKQLQPALRIIVELCREYPSLKNSFLFRCVIGVDTHKGSPARESLHLAQSGPGTLSWQVVNHIDGKYRGKRCVRKR